MHANISHKIYGINRLLAKNEILEKRYIVTAVKTVINNAIIKAVFILLNAKNTGLQIIFKINWTQKAIRDNFFINPDSLKITIMTDKNIKKYKTGQTILKTTSGGVNEGFLIFL